MVSLRSQAHHIGSTGGVSGIEKDMFNGDANPAPPVAVGCNAVPLKRSSTNVLDTLGVMARQLADIDPHERRHSLGSSTVRYSFLT